MARANLPIFSPYVIPQHFSAMLFQHVCLLVAACLMWGGNAVVNKIAVQTINPITLTLLRFAFAIPFLAYCQRPAIPFMRIALVSVVMAAQWIFLNMSLQFGLSASICALIINTGSAFACVFYYVFFGRKPSLENVLGIIISLLGLVILNSNLRKGVTLAGFGCGIIAAICLALVIVLSKWALNGVKDVKQQWSFTVYSSSLTFFLLIPIFLIVEGLQGLHSILHISLQGLICVSYSGLISNLLGMYVVSWLIARYEPYSIMQFNALIPVFGFMGGVLFLEERINENLVMAFAFIIIGLFVSNGRLK